MILICNDKICFENFDGDTTMKAEISCEILWKFNNPNGFHTSTVFDRKAQAFITLNALRIHTTVLMNDFDLHYYGTVPT